MKLELVAFLLLVLPAIGYSQSINGSSLIGESQIIASGNGISCGIVIRYVEPTKDQDQRLFAIAAHVRFDSADGNVILEFGVTDYLFKPSVEETMQSTRLRQVENGWLTIAGASPITDRGSKSYLEPVGARYSVGKEIGLPVMRAILKGESIVVGVKLKDYHHDIARASSVWMNTSDALKVQSCLDVMGFKPGK